MRNWLSNLFNNQIQTWKRKYQYLLTRFNHTYREFIILCR